MMVLIFGKIEDLLLKNFIVDENPDFAGLQEVTYSQLIFLTKSLKIMIM